MGSGGAVGLWGEQWGLGGELWGERGVEERSWAAGVWGSRESLGRFGGAVGQEWGLGEQGGFEGFGGAGRAAGGCSKGRGGGCRLRPGEMPRKVRGCRGVPQGRVLGVREVWGPEAGPRGSSAERGCGGMRFWGDLE